MTREAFNRVYAAVGISIMFGAVMLHIITAHAQQRPQSAAETSLIAAIQQVGASVTIYAEQKQREIAALEAQIASLREKCGEPCK